MAMAAAIAILFSLAAAAAAAAAAAPAGAAGHATAILSDKGLTFAKDLLVYSAVHSLTPLPIPGMEKGVRIPFLGGVRMAARNITLQTIAVNESSVHLGSSGATVVASGVTAKLTLNWSYEYDVWLLPYKVSDSGGAAVSVEGMEVGVTMSITSLNGAPNLSVVQCGCFLKDLVITLNGGAAWFYQGFINALEAHLRSAVETAIVEKISEGTEQMDTMLQDLPKSLKLNDVAALNVSVLNDPRFENSSVEFDFDGLFAPVNRVAGLHYRSEIAPDLLSCDGASKMLLVSLDEDAFNSASEVYFKAGLLQWVVDKIPDQELLNTAGWKFIIPRLYSMYPNDDMLLNISITSPPVVKITSEKVGTTVYSDVILDVLDGSTTVPVVCISVTAAVSVDVEMVRDRLTGMAKLESFSLALKWSEVGRIYVRLIQGVMRIILNTVVVPYLNSHLAKGIQLPAICGFTLRDAYVSTSSSKMVVCSDVSFTNASTY